MLLRYHVPLIVILFRLCNVFVTPILHILCSMHTHLNTFESPHLANTTDTPYPGPTTRQGPSYCTRSGSPHDAEHLPSFKVPVDDNNVIGVLVQWNLSNLDTLGTIQVSCLVE